MAHDPIEALLQKAREYEMMAAHLRESARMMKGDSVVMDATTGDMFRKPDAWRVADDLETILENGEKTMPRDALIQYLVENDLVAGKDLLTKVASAKRALTLGITKGYLRESGGIIHWIPGIYVNTRVRKNT